ncbi:A/G-specific adenine glycosylase [bacterium]|nr:A/G-specific adenine glycosylase [bacterium]MBU1985455.1 A/G-specific adenine glycosylase [bacterium]
MAYSRSHSLFFNRKPARSPLTITEASLRRLIRWYQRNHRDLPWRKTRDPYRIWVSEILLQQTRALTVKSYYTRFLRSFPTVSALAAAPLSAVLKAWEGCGYYARARNLHRAARQVVAEGGRIPHSAAELRKLPGIGPYTAAAIASIAYGESVAVLDGNVERVLIRLLSERRRQKTPVVQRRLCRVADSIMETARRAGISPGELNQALMELGALVCTPRRADCAVCPFKVECRARQSLDDVTMLPRRTPSRELPHYDIGAAILRKNGRILITQRPLDGLLGGLWEFPGGKQRTGESLEECVAREIREELGIEITVAEQVARVRHAYSHFRITLHAFECRQRSGRVKKIGVADFCWVKPEELKRFAFPKADRVVLEILEGKKS